MDIIVQFLRDSMWQSIGAVIGILAIVVTVVIYRRSTTHKSLSYEVISNSPLLAADLRQAEDIQVLHRGNQVTNPSLVILEFINDGNGSVEARDFAEPLTITFNTSCMVLEAKIIKCVPESLKPKIEIIDQSNLIVQPLLLNSGDSFVIHALLSDYHDEIQIGARISGVKEIVDRKIFQMNGMVKLRALMWTLVFLLSFGTAILFNSIPQVPKSLSDLLLIAGTFGGAVGLLGAANSLESSRRR